MSLASRLVIGGLALALFPSARPARAQAIWPVPIEDPMLASLIQEALSHNPELAAARQAAASVENRPTQARSLPNPMLSVAYTNDGWSPSLGSREMTTLAFMASQDLGFPGKRGLRVEISTREARQVRQQADRVERGLRAAVRRAYYGLVVSRELLELIGEQEETWKQIEGVARARYAVGQGAQQNILRVQVEVTRINELRTEQEAEAEIRLAELNRLLARPTTMGLETPTRLTLHPVVAGPVQVVEWAAAVSPEVKAADLGVQRASLALDLAKKEFKPDFGVLAGYMNRGGLDAMWQAGVSISVPLYRQRLSSALAEAEEQLRSSRSASESVRLQLGFRTRERLTRLRATERIATLYDEGIVPQDRMSLAAALANYQTGQVPFISVLEALMTLYNDSATRLRLLASHEQTVAGLEEASLEQTIGMVSANAVGMAPGRGNLDTASPGTAISMSGDSMTVAKR